MEHLGGWSIGREQIKHWNGDVHEALGGVEYYWEGCSIYIGMESRVDWGRGYTALGTKLSQCHTKLLWYDFDTHSPF